MHTDQGGEYTGELFAGACARLGVRQSMGRTGSALDNAVAESFNSTLEFECFRIEAPDGVFDTRAQARAAIAAWIDDYNHLRRHSSIGKIPPATYEQQHHQQPKEVA
jgi:transposase InsO family protein